MKHNYKHLLNTTLQRIYSYDTTGNIAAVTTTISLPQYKVTSTFSFSGGVLTSGSNTNNDGKILPITIENGRIAAYPNSDGSKTRFMYDAGGHNTKEESVNATGVVTGYTTYEFAATPVKQSPTISYKGFPTFSLVGTADLPISRQVSYVNGAVATDIQNQYQANSKGYLTTRTRKVTSMLNNYQTTQTYTYANCQ